MRAKHTALILTAGFLLVPTLSWSQFPGRGEPGAGGAGGMRAMFSDPDRLFDMVAKGQNVIRVDQLDPLSKSMFDRFASRYGLTGNEISRDQFKAAFTRIREDASRGQLNFQGGPRGGGEDRDRRLDDRFQRMDRDQDGVLSHEELSETLQGERDKYDANHDGKIDLNEYRAYVEARIGDARPGGDAARADGGAGRPGDPDEPPEEVRKRPTVLRAGNLPADFPYGMLDQQGDNDGQVGLYEWKNAGRRIGEFVVMDLNNDGFLTVEEFYRWRKQTEGDAGRTGTLAGNFGGRGMNMMGMGPGRGDRGTEFGRGPRGERGDRGDRGERGDRGPGRDRGLGMFGGGAPGGMMAMPGGGRFGGMPGGDRGMDIGGRGPRGFGGTPGMPPGGFGGSGMPGGDRGFGRDRGGDRGSFGGMSGAGAVPQGGPGAPGQFTIPGGGMGPGMRFPGAGRFGGDRGGMGSESRFGGERGDRGSRLGLPGGDGGDRGGRGDRPRKDRDR